MSVHAGTILHVGGANVIDRIQEAGLGDVRLPIETIREVGNYLVVDKVPGEPDFTFTMSSLDVSTDVMAFLQGKVGGSGSASPPGGSDPAGTEYKFEDCQFVTIPSPWKNAAAGSAGTIAAGHLIPGYYPSRVRYRFGVTDNAVQEVELAGGTFYYGKFAPVEEYATGNGATTAYVTSEAAIRHRIGGPAGTTFRSVFGVIVDGVLAIEGVDYTISGGAAGPGGSVATVTFTVAPANGAKIRFSYFTAVAKAYPQSVHASNIVKPGAVRGKHIGIYLGSGGSRQRIASVQSVELEGSVDYEVEREMGSDQIVGISINGRDTNGSITVRSKDYQAFLDLLTKVTGVSQTEIFGYFNTEGIPLEIVIFNPKDPGGTPLKTLYVSDAQFQPPGTPARVNSPTDFAFSWESKNGTFSEYKGAKP